MNMNVSLTEELANSIKAKFRWPLRVVERSRARGVAADGEGRAAGGREAWPAAAGLAGGRRQRRGGRRRLRRLETGSPRASRRQAVSEVRYSRRAREDLLDIWLHIAGKLRKPRRITFSIASKKRVGVRTASRARPRAPRDRRRGEVVGHSTLAGAVSRDLLWRAEFASSTARAISSGSNGRGNRAKHALTRDKSARAFSAAFSNQSIKN